MLVKYNYIIIGQKIETKGQADLDKGPLGTT